MEECKEGKGIMVTDIREVESMGKDGREKGR